MHFRLSLVPTITFSRIPIIYWFSPWSKDFLNRIEISIQFQYYTDLQTEYIRRILKWVKLTTKPTAFRTIWWMKMALVKSRWMGNTSPHPLFLAFVYSTSWKLLYKRFTQICCCSPKMARLIWKDIYHDTKKNLLYLFDKRFGLKSELWITKGSIFFYIRVEFKCCPIYINILKIDFLFPSTSFFYF